MPLACIGLVQALLLLLTLQFGLNLQIDNVGLYYAFGLFTALVFAAIMQVIMAAFGFPGKFAAIILLMLQLTSAAGTFPIEQTPAFFQVISPYFPMTYVVEGMRQIMAGSDLALAAQSALVLLGFGVGCFALTRSGGEGEVGVSVIGRCDCGIVRKSFRCNHLSIGILLYEQRLSAFWTIELELFCLRQAFIRKFKAGFTKRTCYFHV